MVCVTLTKRKLFTFLLIIAASALLCGEIGGCFVTSRDAVTNADRVGFAEYLGYRTSGECSEEKKITLPYTDDAAFSEFNREQAKKNFDMSAFCGCEVTVYSYPARDASGTLDIYSYKGRVIGYKWKSKDSINS